MIQPAPRSRLQKVTHYILVAGCVTAGLAVVVLYLAWCTGYADMIYDQRLGEEMEEGTYCWDHGDPHPHYLGHKVSTDHVCTGNDLADAARRRFEAAVDVKPYRNDLSAATVSHLVDYAGLPSSFRGEPSCRVLEIRGSTALADCGSAGQWYVTRQGNVFRADSPR